MPQSRLVHGQRLGTGEVGTGYIVVGGPSEHGMFKIICIIYIYIQWVPVGLYIDDSFGIYDDIYLFTVFLRMCIHNILLLLSLSMTLHHIDITLHR